MDSTELQNEKKKGEELFSQGKYVEARNVYNAMEGFAGKDPDIFVRLGDIATKLDDDFLAMDNYKKAAAAYSKCGSAIKAIAICKKILSLHPSRAHVKDSLTTLSAQLKFARERAAAKEKSMAAERKSSLGNHSTDADSSEPLIHISEEDLIDDNLLEVQSVPHQETGPVEPIKDGFDDFDDFIEDYIEIVEHVGEDSLSIDTDNARERGLKRTPLFSDLSVDELMGVICQLNVCFVDMGEYVFRRGDEGQSIFIITSGAAEVISYTKYGEEVKYATLTDGDFFGEHEYFSGTTRRTEVRAVTDLELFKIKRNEMAALTARNPYMAKVLYDFYKERVLDKAMALSKVFKHMSIKDRKEMLETVQVESYPSGTDIVKYNDKGDNMFLVVSGTAEVWRPGPDGEKETLSTLQENDYFGEVAMMLDRARTSNVTAVTTVDAILIGREHLDGVLARYPIIKKVLEDVAMKHVKDNDTTDSTVEG